MSFYWFDRGVSIHGKTWELDHGVVEFDKVHQDEVLDYLELGPRAYVALLEQEGA